MQIVSAAGHVTLCSKIWMTEGFTHKPIYVTSNSFSLRKYKIKESDASHVYVEVCCILFVSPQYYFFFI